MRLAENGCLLDRLKENRANPYVNVENKKATFTETDKVKIARDVADGMLHLSSKVVNVYQPSIYTYQLSSIDFFCLPLLIRSVFIGTSLHEMYFLTRIMLPWYLILACHVIFTRVVHTSIRPGYENENLN